MALLAALFAYLGRQLSTLVQAILGWSVTALFGSLPSMKQTALAGALLLSLLWPIALVGVFVPPVSAWAFAFLPLQKWIGEGSVRWITLGIAVVLPLIVGAVTRWVAPRPDAPRFSLRSLLSGYPLTIGYAVACLVTAVTVPLVKVMSAIRGWSDEHVYVQPRPGMYDRSLEELLAACTAAGVTAHIEPVPKRMRFASTVLKWFARGIVKPMMAEEPKMLRADGLEVYLYPADLLLRGQAAKLAHVRAAMTRTWLEGFAYTVADPDAQALQNELQRMWDVVRRHHDAHEIGHLAVTRLREISRDLDHSAVPFEQWISLDRSLHRLERVLSGGTDLLENDTAVRGHRAHEEKLDRKETGMVKQSHPQEPAELHRSTEPTGQLIREALDETRHLVQIEIALARQELREEITQAKAGAIALGAAALGGTSALTMFLVALALALQPSWLVALVVGGVLFLLATAAGIFGWKSLPKQPMGATRSRLESDYKQLEERIA